MLDTLLFIYLCGLAITAYGRVFIWFDERKHYHNAIDYGWKTSMTEKYIQYARDYQDASVRLFTYPVLWPMYLLLYLFDLGTKEIGKVFAISDEIRELENASSDTE